MKSLFDRKKNFNDDNAGNINFDRTTALSYFIDRSNVAMVLSKLPDGSPLKNDKNAHTVVSSAFTDSQNDLQNDLQNQSKQLSSAPESSASSSSSTTASLPAASSSGAGEEGHFVQPVPVTPLPSERNKSLQSLKVKISAIQTIAIGLNQRHFNNRDAYIQQLAKELASYLAAQHQKAQIDALARDEGVELQDIGAAPQQTTTQPLLEQMKNEVTPKLSPEILSNLRIVCAALGIDDKTLAKQPDNTPYINIILNKGSGVASLNADQIVEHINTAYTAYLEANKNKEKEPAKVEPEKGKSRLNFLKSAITGKKAQSSQYEPLENGGESSSTGSPSSTAPGGEKGQGSGSGGTDTPSSIAKDGENSKDGGSGSSTGTPTSIAQGGEKGQDGGNSTGNPTPTTPTGQVTGAPTHQGSGNNLIARFRHLLPQNKPAANNNNAESSSIAATKQAIVEKIYGYMFGNNNNIDEAFEKNAKAIISATVNTAYSQLVIDALEAKKAANKEKGFLSRRKQPDFNETTALEQVAAKETGLAYYIRVESSAGASSSSTTPPQATGLKGITEQRIQDIAVQIKTAVSETTEGEFKAAANQDLENILLIIFKHEIGLSQDRNEYDFVDEGEGKGEKEKLIEGGRKSTETSPPAATTTTAATTATTTTTTPTTSTAAAGASTSTVLALPVSIYAGLACHKQMVCNTPAELIAQLTSVGIIKDSNTPGINDSNIALMRNPATGKLSFSIVGPNGCFRYWYDTNITKQALTNSNVPDNIKGFTYDSAAKTLSYSVNGYFSGYMPGASKTETIKLDSEISISRLGQIESIQKPLEKDTEKENSENGSVKGDDTKKSCLSWVTDCSTRGKGYSQQDF